MSNFLYAAGAAAGRYNDLYDMGVKAKANKKKNAAADKSFTVGFGPGAITLEGNPLNATTADNRTQISKSVYESFISDSRNANFIQLANDEEVRNAFVSALIDGGKEEEAAAFNKRFQDFNMLRDEAINWYTTPIKGENNAYVHTRTVPAHLLKNDPFFAKRIATMNKTDSSNYTADINRTLDKLQLTNDAGVTDVTAADVNTAPLDIQFFGQNIMSQDPSVDEAPTPIEVPTLRNWAINSMDSTWEKHDRIGLTIDETKEWGQSIVEQGQQGRFIQVITAVSEHIPLYGVPEELGPITSLVAPAEDDLTQSEKDYTKTRSELGLKVLNIADEMYKLILDPINGIGIVAATANWQSVIDRYAGTGGIIDQAVQLGRNIKNEGYVLGSNIIETTADGKQIRKAQAKSREDEIKLLKSMGIDTELTIAEHMARVNKVGGAARLESLTITLAFAIAIANQDFQGGKAVSDNDFRQAYLQVTGGATQGSLFSGFSKPEILLATVKQVRDGVLPAVIESTIFNKAHDGKKRRTAEFIMTGLNHENITPSELVHIFRGRPDKFDNLYLDAARMVQNRQITKIGGLKYVSTGFFGRDAGASDSVISSSRNLITNYIEKNK